VFSFFHAGMHGVFACFYSCLFGLEQFVTWIVHVVRHENEGDDDAPKDTTPEGSFLEPDPWCPFSWQLWDCCSFDICVW
jgi:hypothetical protein